MELPLLRASSARIVLVLTDRKVWRHDSPGPLSIRCRSGSVWLTCGDGADHILEGGARWETKRPASIVVEALEPSTLQLETVGLRSAGIGSCVPDPDRATENSAARDAASG